MGIQLDVTQPVRLIAAMVNEKKVQAASLTLLLLLEGDMRNQVATHVASLLAPDTWYDHAWKIACGKILDCEQVVQLDDGVLYATKETITRLTSLSKYFSGHELFGEDGLVLPVRTMHSVPTHRLH